MFKIRTLMTILFLVPSVAMSLSRQKVLELVQQDEIRESSAYQRLHRICQSGLEFSQLVYVGASAEQTLEIASFDQKEFNRIISEKSGVSPLLAHDLNDPALFLATADCGYNQDQRDYFVMSLITLDLSGKLLGAVGAYGLMRSSLWAINQIRAFSPTAYWALTVGGSAMAVRKLYHQLIQTHSPSQNSNNPGPDLKESKREIDHTFPTEKISQETHELTEQIRSLLKQELQSTETQLKSDPNNLELQNSMKSLQEKLQSLQ